MAGLIPSNFVSVWTLWLSGMRASLHFVLCLFVVYSFGKAEGGACLLRKNLRLRIFQRVELVLGMRVGGIVKLF